MGTRTAIWSDEGEIRARLEAELDRLLRVLDARTDIEQVWSHGSLVDGGLHATSDLDLLVVQDTDLGPVERAIELRIELAPTVPLDLVVVTPEELADDGRFLEHVRTHGRRLR